MTYRYQSSAYVGDAWIEVIVDESGNFSVETDGTKLAVTVMLRLIADDIEGQS